MRRPVNAVLILLATAAVACDPGQPLPAAGPSASPIGAPVSASPAASATSIPPSLVVVGAPPPVAGELPNPALTPGEIFADATAAQVCAPGYAGSARNVAREQYVEVYAAYAIPYPEPAGTYELDHLVPLELGGDNANRNLWPERAAPAPGFHQKDQLENYLHDAVCSGRMALSDAQRGIAVDWLSLYREYLQP